MGVGLFGIAAANLVALLVLHRLGPSPRLSDVAGWLATARIEEVLMLGLRWTGLALAYWIALSVLVAGLASIRRGTRFGLVARRLMVPFVRHLLDRTLVLAIAIAPVAPSVPAWASPPAALPIEILPPYVPVPAGPEKDETETREPPDNPAIIPALPGVTSPAPGDTYVVVKGDNLWRIACRQVRAETGGKPTSSQIVPYWLELIELNRDRLRSGDPDLIYPGEELLLP
ncbi:MAG: LysM peptidoglycan-binding domain-containing protein [Acidimicrobiia bacterium]